MFTHCLIQGPGPHRITSSLNQRCLEMYVIIMILALTSSMTCQTVHDILGPFEEVCKTSEYTYGCGYISYPGQCDKFIKCYEQQKTYLIRTCPSGLHWDALSETCNYPCAAKCAAEYNPCQLKWAEVLKTDNNGGVVSGNKADLQKALETGARIKIGMSTYSAEVDNCQKIGTDVCCEALLHISYKNWEEFQSGVYWWMINICTTGNYHMVRYYVGGSFLSETKTKGSFTWFVLKDKTGFHKQPVYSTAQDGSVTRGSRNALTQAVKQGKSISVVTGRNVVFPIQNIEIWETPEKSEIVSAQHVWSVSQTIAGNHLEYQANAYWWFLVLTTKGTRDMSRWNLGSHTSRGHTSDTVSMDWFVDDCWTKVYSTNEDGPKGARHLVQLAESGHRVRVQFDNVIMEADNIRLASGYLSAQLVSALARVNATSFEDDLNWEFKVIGQAGSVRTYRPLVGSTAVATLGTTVQRKDLTWFVDTKKWELLFHIAMNGSVITGSALAVRHAVEEGADIRLGYRLPGDPGYRYSKADNINFGPKPDVSAQLVRLLSDHPASNTEFKLDTMPHWSFRLVTTKGDVRTSEWVVGDHVNRARTRQKGDIKWYASF